MMAELDIDLLALIVVSRSQSKKLMARLNKQHFYFTIIDTRGSLFHEPTVLLLLGLNQARQETLNNLVRKYCQPHKRFVPVQMRGTGELTHLPVIETIEGGAIFYSMPVEHFEQI
ncbi:MAG: cyclic-di-AMP receptor [Brevefilum sp.]